MRECKSVRGHARECKSVRGHARECKSVQGSLRICEGTKVDQAYIQRSGLSYNLVMWQGLYMLLTV